jgi:hypothetical protein
MNGIKTRYFSSAELKSAHTWHECVSVDPANRSGSFVVSFKAGALVMAELLFQITVQNETVLWRDADC